MHPAQIAAAPRRDQFTATIYKNGELVDGLAADRDPIGSSIDALDRGTTTIADLLGVPEEDHDTFRAELADNPTGVGSSAQSGVVAIVLLCVRHRKVSHESVFGFS